MTQNNNYFSDIIMELQRTDNERTPQSQSILGIMKNFIDSVNDMDETVLIPSRLMDMKMDSAYCESTMTAQSNSNSTSSEDSMSVISSSSESTPAIVNDQVSLLTYYSMLKAVKRELARGPSGDDELSDEEEEDGNMNHDPESVRLQTLTARAFRNHLRGLFSILTHLTNISKHLTDKYQQETGDHQSCLKPKTFTV
ncbi:mid1-interacting protein 1-like [Diadema setosum]|uniref:mid1-interacting protein 1-like n=1 Tax=Diadema antillarum TaxID=105358 RepID=UPI003A83D625